MTTSRSASHPMLIVPTRNSSSMGVSRGAMSSMVSPTASEAAPPAKSSSRSLIRSASVPTCCFSSDTLADRINDLLDDFAGGAASDAVGETIEDIAPLDTPIEDEFRVGTMSIGWDAERDVVILECHDGQEDVELDEEGEPTLEPERPGEFETVLRVVLVPGQARAQHAGRSRTHRAAPAQGSARPLRQARHLPDRRGTPG